MYKVTIFIFLIIVSPLNLSSNEIYQEKFDYILRLDMFSKVDGINGVMSYDNFRSKFKKIAVVTFVNNCKPCESKMKKWMLNSSSLSGYDEFAVLFILRGFDLEDIVNKFKQKCKFNKNYFFVDDFRYLYTPINKDIPIDLLEKTVVIGEFSKIIFSGDPFLKNELKKDFITIISGY
jgi:hypothetical protein